MSVENFKTDQSFLLLPKSMKISILDTSQTRNGMYWNVSLLFFKFSCVGTNDCTRFTVYCGGVETDSWNMLPTQENKIGQACHLNPDCTGRCDWTPSRWWWCQVNGTCFLVISLQSAWGSLLSSELLQLVEWTMKRSVVFLPFSNHKVFNTWVSALNGK